MWAKPEDDPRAGGSPVGELATIREYLSNYRLTLGMKCEDLSPEQLATRSVPPSTLSLLGLIRHMARVEHNWFQRSPPGRRRSRPPTSGWTGRSTWTPWSLRRAVSRWASATSSFT